VGDEDDRLAHLLLQPQELRLQPLAHHRVHGGERLVHEQHRRVGGERPGDAGPLALAARELGRIAVAEPGRVQAHGGQQFIDALGDPALVPAEQPRHRAHVGPHGLVREEPDALDHVADAPPEPDRVDPGDVVVAEQDPPGARLDQPVDHLHRGRLAAPRGPDQHRQLTGGEGEVELGHADRAVGVDLADPLEADPLRAAVRRARGRPGAAGLGTVHGMALLGCARC
jgi:hypothetical protein